MELLLELLLTLFVAVVFSFLIAKLISFASAADDQDQQPSVPASSIDLDGAEFLAPELTVEDECRFRDTDSQNTDRLVLQGVHEEVCQFENIESVNKLESSISRDELVQEQLRESAATIDDVDVLCEKRVVVGSLEKFTEIEFIGHEFPAEIAQEVEVKGLKFEENVDIKESDETTKENLVSMVSTRFDESGDFGELKAVNSLVAEEKILENVEADDRIGNEEEVDDTRHEEAMEVKNDQNQGGDERNQEWSDGNEDEWEGVEQSKLQKVFDQASKFVANMGEDIWGNDLHMQLYGLHKVALEGPCQEPQPMALKLSARSKWNSWQRLGNMSPDVAMEHYINLLKDKYPQWMEENQSGDITKKTQEAGAPGDQDHIEDKPYEGKQVEMEVKFTTG